MDFIINLLLFIDLITKKIYNNILIIVNKHTKYVFFIPFRKNYLIAKFIYIFLDKVIKIRKFLKKIISNQNRLFILLFWKIFLKEKGIKIKLLIIYYPQINK